MNISADFVYNLDRHTLSIPAEVRMVFLCGVVFKRRDDKDKRKVLKDYLSKNPINLPIILEENFSIKKYADIDLGNLHDVEVLVACFADAVIIIHESIATGAELGMFATNKSIAQKILVLYPDSDSVEEDKINIFISEAFYGKDPILSRERSLVSYHPVIKDYYESNDRYVYHTYFPNDLKTRSEARDRVDSFLAEDALRTPLQFTFAESKFERLQQDSGIVDYYVKNGELNVFLSPVAIRSLLFSLLTLKEVRDLIESKQSLSEVITAIQMEFDKILHKTLHEYISEDVSSVRVALKGLDQFVFRATSKEGYRKAVGLFVFLLKAMNFLSTEKSGTLESFKFTRSFSDVRGKYAGTITTRRLTQFERIKQEAHYD